MDIRIKALGDWELDVLGVPFGGPDNRDADGEWFDAQTRYHEDKYGLPPIVYYHGYQEDGQPAGAPAYIGKSVSRRIAPEGVWYRVILDKANELAKRVWEAAQQGIARASSGSVSHLVRKNPDGRILEWPVAELSVFDAEGSRQPANRYAVALPVAKALWDTAGLTWPETQAEAGNTAPGVEPESKTVTLIIGDTKMEDKDIQAMVAKAAQDAADAAIKAERERVEAEAAAKAAQDAKVAEAVEAAKATWASENAASNRLPGGASAPVMKYHKRWNGVTPAEHALIIDIMRSARRAPSDECVKALAARLEGEDGKLSYSVYGAEALKGLGLKSDEVHYSTLASHGDEWVGILYSTNLWEVIRQQTWVLDRLMSQGRVVQIPQGMESGVIPLESTDPTWYKVAQINDLSSNRPAATITPSQLTTAQKAITVSKIGASSFYSGELQEDSLVNFASQLLAQLGKSGAEIMEHLIIDGDTETGASTNINDIDGTPDSADVFLAIDGFRKLALITNTANSRSAGTLTEDDYLETVKLLGAAGMNALDQSKVTLIPDVNTYWKSLALASLKTPDVFPQATLVNGSLARIWGYEVKPSAQMHRESAKRMAEATGKIDQTDSDNTTGAILAVRWDQWAWAWKRMMTIKTDEYIDADAKQIVAMARFGMTYRDTEASSISYNVTL